MKLKVLTAKDGTVGNVSLVDDDERTGQCLWQRPISQGDEPFTSHYFELPQGPNTPCSQVTAGASIPDQAIGPDDTSATNNSSLASKNCANQSLTCTADRGVTTIQVVVSLRQ